LPNKSTSYSRLPGSELDLPNWEPAVLPAGRILPVTIRVRRNPASERLPDTAGMKAPPERLVSRDEFLAAHSACREDLAKVEVFAKLLNLRVRPLEELNSIARRSVFVEGTISDLERSFQVMLRPFKEPRTERILILRSGPVCIPTELLGIVEGVFGLDERPIGNRAASATVELTTAALLTPRKIAQYYNFPQGDAAGEIVALLEFGGGFNQADVDNYIGQPVSIASISIDGAVNDPTDLYFAKEVTLDIEVAASIVPGAKLDVYFAPRTEQGWIDAVSAALLGTGSTALPSVLSISWGGAELQATDTLSWSRAGLKILHEHFNEAALLGVTVLAASGDTGTQCGISDGDAHVLYPASDPGVIACGGTVMNAVTGLADEATWNQSGGGVSEVFDIPVWQATLNLPLSVNDASAMAGVPDLAGYAYPGCNFMFDTDTFLAAGTSITAPLYAALVALINANKGKRVGFIVPVLYQLAAEQNSKLFQDMQDMQRNAFGGAPGYYSFPGWDACTGLGAVRDVTELIAAL
jgi:kumamolisin